MSRMRAGLFVQVAVLVILAVLPAVASAGTLNWSAPINIDGNGRLEGLSCPSASLCVAGDEFFGRVLTSTTPETGGWSAPQTTRSGFDDLSCPSESFCAGVGGSMVNVSTNPTGGASAWTAYPIDPVSFLLGVSCSSASFCVAVDEGGNVIVDTGTAWEFVGPIGGVGRLYGVSCPSESFCAAVGGNGPTAGSVLTSTNPKGGELAWSATQVEPTPGNELNGITCTSASFCIAVGSNGTIATSTDPTGGSSAWSVTHIGSNEALGGGLSRVSCPTESFCVVGNFAVDNLGGNVATSNNPTGGAATWTISHVDPGVGILSVSCSSEDLCVAGDAAGNVLVGSTSPPPHEETEETPHEEAQPTTPGNDDAVDAPPSTAAPVAIPLPAAKKPAIKKPHRKPLKCRKGLRKQHVHGKAKCVRVKKRHLDQRSVPPTMPSAAASEGAICDYPDHFNTVVCDQPKKSVEAYCAESAEGDWPEGLHSGYVDGSKRKYGVSFRIQEISGCAPAGQRKVSVFQELRQGPNGTFKKNSNTASHKSVYDFEMDKTLIAPYNCSAKGMAGSAVRTIVQLTWIPKKGWPGKPSTSTFGEDNKKGTPVC